MIPKMFNDVCDKIESADQDATCGVCQEKSQLDLSDELSDAVHRAIRELNPKDLCPSGKPA